MEGRDNMEKVKKHSILILSALNLALGMGGMLFASWWSVLLHPILIWVNYMFAEGKTSVKKMLMLDGILVLGAHLAGWFNYHQWRIENEILDIGASIFQLIIILVLFFDAFLVLGMMLWSFLIRKKWIGVCLVGVPFLALLLVIGFFVCMVIA